MLSLALAAHEGVATLSSTELAGGLHTTPSLVRKQLAPLIDAGLVTSKKGAHGGLALARAAASITLAAVYRAVVVDRPLFSARSEIPHRCVVSSNIGHLFGDV